MSSEAYKPTTIRGVLLHISLVHDMEQILCSVKDKNNETE